MNVLGRRFDYLRTWNKRKPKIIQLIKNISPDICTLTECQPAEAKELALGAGYYYTNYLGSTILYKKNIKANKLKEYSWLKGYTQSAVVAEFTFKDGNTINVAASHLPPFSWRASLRKRQQKILCDLFANWKDPVIIGTDANWPKTFESFIKSLKGFWSSSRLTATKKTHSDYRTSRGFKVGNPIDYVIGRNYVDFQTYLVVTGSGRSDHNGIVVTALCGKPDVKPDTR